MQLLSLSEVRRHAQNGAAVEARVHVQIEGVASKVTREQKPYCELHLADACDRMTLRVWSDHPEYRACGSLKASDFIELTGEFGQHQQFGLVEHVAQMMRLAMAIQPLYSQLNLDLLIAGVLFHDAGKLWENHLPETGFTMGYDERGELMGHISIGLELVNSIWRKLQTEENTRAWNSLKPASEDVRMHLLHLIGAHHGEPQFGSPVSPKTPEAMALNYIDNLDA